MDFEEQEDVEEIREEDDFLGLDEEFATTDEVQKKDAVMFLVDCNEKLFKSLDGKESQFRKILAAFQSFLKSKIISNVDDRIGMIFYNTKLSNNPLNFDGITEVYGLESPSADRIRDCLKLEQRFDQDFQLGPKAMIHQCFWLCTNQFRNLEKNKFSMRIFLFTTDDVPYFKDQNARDQTIQHAKQLKELDVQIELFPIESGDGNEFKINRFYSEIITVDLDEVNNAVLDQSSKIMDLHQRLKQKEYKKRAINRITLDLSDVKIGFKIFALINKAKKPTSKPLERKTNSTLKKKQQFLCSETGDTLYPNQVQTYVMLGNEKVPLSKDQMSQIKSFEKPSLTLIGFKDIKSLKDYHNIRTAYFLYPDEEHVTGSSQFCDALIDQMINKKRLAIVRLTPRKGSQVKFCALIPQIEKYDDDHFQTPPGFHLIFLPYADDIRPVPDVNWEGTEVSRDGVNTAKILVNALTIQDFDCSNFEDPAIQKFYTYLQGTALGEQNIEEPEDLLQPDYLGMQRYRDIVDLFKNTISMESGVDKQVQKRRGRQNQAQKIEEEIKQEKIEDDSEQPKQKRGGRRKK
ncbi:hypothetical protein pb186bvf_005734 [Paramecium bursaria]